MKFGACNTNEVDPNDSVSAWSTDEHGGPIQIRICRDCSETEAEQLSETKHENKLRNLSSVYVSTTDKIPTKEVVEYLGPVRGSTVRAKHVGRDLTAGLKNIVGGEIVGYTELLAEAREEALYRMKLDAERLGANAVVGFRFSTSTIDLGASEVTAYGTAVVVENY